MPTLRLIFRMAPVRQLASYCDLAANNKYASSSQLDPRSLKGKETFEAVFCFVFSFKSMCELVCYDSFSTKYFYQHCLLQYYTPFIMLLSSI